MTTMVMSSAIKPSDIGIRKISEKHRGGKLQENQEMQWVFLTTAKRRSSVEEPKLVRVDSKHKVSDVFSQKHNVTCLQSEDELKVKFGEKWLSSSRNKHNGISNAVTNFKSGHNKRDRLQSFRLPRRQQSMRDSLLSSTSSEKNKHRGNYIQNVHIDIYEY